MKAGAAQAVSNADARQSAAASAARFSPERPLNSALWNAALIVLQVGAPAADRRRSPALAGISAWSSVAR